MRLVAWLLLGLTILPAHAEEYPGLDGDIRVVTTLADSGPGSLREAVAATGPRMIVFAVGGRIRLHSMLAIRHGTVTIAGETAPSPGLTLTGNTLQISASDVHLRHLRIRVGADTDQPKDNLDGIRILGHTSGPPLDHVIIDHCSVSWAVDEGLSLWRPPIQDVTIRDTIISETLGQAGHSKGQHSMGLLVGPGMGPVRIIRNLFAQNRSRNPVLTSGSEVLVSGNVIYNYGWSGIHSYERTGTGPLLATISGNVVIPGPSSERPPVLDLRRINPGSQVHVADNTTLTAGTTEPAAPLPVRGSLPPAPQAPHGLAAPDSLLPPSALVARVLDTAGARPWDRDATDQRVVQSVRDGTGTVIDTPPEAELDPAPPPVLRPLTLPVEPMADANRRARRLEWLQEFLRPG